MNLLFTHNRLQKKTHDQLEIIAETSEAIDKLTDQLILSDEIVGAQFYYSNPFLYLFLNPKEDLMPHGKLYHNIYLLSPQHWNHLDMQNGIIAVNQAFLDAIGGSKEFLNDFNIDTLTQHHNEIGLYLIGIQEENR